jgi:predicted phage baseplate assembly protein
MSLSRDPTIRHLDGCGCCDGLGAETPEAIANRPGLSAIAYRIGTHGRFKASMLARLSAADLPALNALTTRSDRDFSIALLDAWATAADVLTFYQERIAVESYLGTATERRSLVELANLVGYVPRPGVAAAVYLAFTLDATGIPADTPVPRGTRVQSIPGPGQQPQVFETVEEIAARPEWNAMRPLLVQKHPTPATDTETVTVRGTAANVQQGDSLLLLCGAGTDNRVVKRVVRVAPDPVAQTTRIDLVEDPPDPPPFIFTYLPLASFVTTPAKLTSFSVASAVFSGSWKQADLSAFASVQKWSTQKLSLNIVAKVAAALKVIAPEFGVFAFRQRAAIFGHNAPAYSSLPANQRMTDHITGSTGALVPVPPPYPDSWEGRTLSAEPGGNQRRIDLDNTYPGIVAGSWLVLDDAARRHVYRVQGTSELTRAAFTLTAKVTRVELDSDTDFAGFTLRATSVLAQSERLELAELPILDVVKGSRLVLDGPYLGLSAGRPVVVSGERADLEGVQESEVMILADALFNEGLTELVFAQSLVNEYVRATVTVNANVALATHGETREQALGSGDGHLPFQKFTLPEAPLTYTSANTPRGASSTLHVRVNGLLWNEVDFLYGRAPEDRVYITRSDEEGRTTVQFGDGRTAARLPTGMENVRVTYRKGMGEEGLVDEGQLSLLLTRPLGVRGVTNPVAAGDAAAAEGRDDVRRNAPLAIRALDRIVSLRDYEDFARAFAGVTKALATWTWDGRQRGVFITVAGSKGKDIPPSSQTYANLLTAIRQAGDAAVPVRVRSYTPAFFRLAGTVKVGPAHQTADVLAAVEAELRRRFGFDARAFGQPVHKSEVIAAMQGIAGVLAVDLNDLYRTDATAEQLAAGRLFDVLTAHVPRAGTDVTVAAELLQLDPRPLELGVMSA